jgi:LysM repeat protein
LAVAAALTLAACGMFGNNSKQKGPTATLPPLPTTTTTVATTTTAGPKSYIVQRGDSLSKIAKQFGVSVAAIVAANNIANADHIEEGQRLTIPPAGAASAPSTAAGPTTAPPAATTVAGAPTTAKATTTTAKPATTAKP